MEIEITKVNEIPKSGSWKVSPETLKAVSILESLGVNEIIKIGINNLMLTDEEKDQASRKQVARFNSARGRIKEGKRFRICKREKHDIYILRKS